MAGLPGIERDTRIAVTGLGEPGRRAAPHARQAQQPSCDPPLPQVVVALRLLDPTHDETRAREGPQIGVERVHVLVDPVRLLLRLIGHVARRADRPRPLVERADHAVTPGDARHLAHHRAEVERVVERGDAVRKVEGAGGEREVLAVRLHEPERADAPLVEGRPPETDVGVGEDVGRDVRDAAGDEVLRRPRLRRPDLEHPHPRPHVPLEQERERVLGRAPVLVIPAEVAVEVRKVGVDLVVGLVPAVRLRHRRPALDLAPLLGDARKPVVEHARYPVLDRKATAARRAGKHVAFCGELSATDGAAEDVEWGKHRPDGVLCTGSPAYTRA